MREDGHAAVELAMAIAVLMLPVALVVTGFGPWSETRVLAESTAAEAARAVALELDHSAGVEVVVATAVNGGVELAAVRLGWCGQSTGPVESPAGSCPLTRGSTVEAVVEIWTPLFETPWGAIGGLWVGANHAEPVDLYRSLG